MANVLQQTTSSNVVLGGLARLSPRNLMPERYSRHMQTVIKLKQIRSALVSSANGSYAIDVYTPSHSTSRIPTSVKAAAEGQHLDAHINTKFSDLVNLRDELYESCKTSHPTTNCPFCSEVARTLLLGAVLPGSVLTLVLSQPQQTKAVQRFVDSVLQLAASCPIIDADACACQEKLPRQLSRFLFGESDPLA
ncbi:hypothetical protein PHYPSEUDO_009293 [Phytophthora pseudosyringae]|uniref:Uncharacterized protein n=1 Tax=Phytophthora pseudosyringae TaxID=221518 RepID=A0A8T1VCY7_9STRA|nr:hypothetical protein PHYPSEUDO_009293 [Phytophthora pseudosyringae]